MARCRLPWYRFHWSLALDCCRAATDWWYCAWLISLWDRPARIVATIVMITGVETMILSQTVLGGSIAASLLSSSLMAMRDYPSGTIAVAGAARGASRSAVQWAHLVALYGI